jgi:serine/threonine protein kinase
MTSGSLPFANYHRASHLGDGTFGSVVTVYNDDGEEFALKLFLTEEEDSPQPINLGVLREISCLRLLRGENKHENIVEMKDVQADWSDEDENGGGAGTSGCLGMALPLGKWGSLADAVQKSTFLAYPKAVKVQLAHGLLSAIAFLHDNGIVHRDIKCDNILLEHDNSNDWKPILIDFSLAKPVDGTIWGDASRDAELEFLQHTGEVGTLVYTAPEIVSQEGYGKPSDLYSVGVVLLELLQNELFTAEKSKEATAQIAQAVNKLAQGAPFPDLVRKLLEPDPEDRPNARQALSHEIFAKFGCPPTPARRIVNVATALPYDTADDDVEENESPNQPAKSVKNKTNKKIERRLKTIDKLLHELDSEHPWTRWAALEYSLQLDQLDEDIDDISNSQSLADCCLLAHRFFELDIPDLEELEERTSGPFANWTQEDYIDNEATIFMTLDYCLYPRTLPAE